MSGETVGVAAVAGVVDRPRLYRILDSPHVRVCVVQGPSGSGKTTLLRSWAIQQERPPAVTWVSLGSGTATRQTFWQHVAGSAARLGSLRRDAAVQIRSQLSAAVDPVRIATGLLAHAGPVVLILDAYENLGDAMAEVDEDLARLVAALPELRVMVTTRAGTALADADLPDGGIARVISLGDLALTSDEIGALIAEQTGIDDDRLTRSVASATRGFPLTVRAVVLALSQLGRIPRVDSMEWDAVVAARLESLLPDPVAVRFVTDTSVPPYVDEDLAAQLSGIPETARLLDTLERNGFGRWIPYARHRPVFQYVETIRDTFRARASDDADRFRRSCAVTARWLLQNEEIDEALVFAIAGADYVLADRVFVALVISDPESYITDRFLPVLRSIPEAVLSEHPMLAFGLGLALTANPILRLEAPRAFRIAIHSPAQPRYLDPVIDTFTLAGMRAVACRTANAFREGAEAAAEVVGSLDAIDPAFLVRHGEHVGTILRQLSFTLLQGGRIDEALAAARRSVALCSSQTARNYSIVYAAGTSAFAGDLKGARSFLSRIDTDAWPEELRRTYLNGPGIVAEGYARLDALDFAGALGVLRDTDCFTSTTEFWPFLTAISVSARHGLGQGLAEAQRVTRALAGPTPPGIGDNVATEHLHAVLAVAWMAGGDHRTAGRLLDGQPAESPYLAGARVAWLLGAGHDREALRQARAFLELPGHTLRTRAETQTVAAVAALRQDEQALAWSWLNDAAVAWETAGPRVHAAALDPRDRRRLGELARERDSVSLQRYLDVPVFEARPGSSSAVALTPRESVVLGALAEHGSIREMAGALVVSPHTIKSQLQGVYRKLGVSSRQSALSAARELGLLDRAPADR